MIQNKWINKKVKQYISVKPGINYTEQQNIEMEFILLQQSFQSYVGGYQT